MGGRAATFGARGAIHSRNGRRREIRRRLDNQKAIELETFQEKEKTSTGGTWVRSNKNKKAGNHSIFTRRPPATALFVNSKEINAHSSNKTVNQLKGAMKQDSE
jgi:hypothetical protein